MSDKINGVSTETLKEVDRQLALFKEGEKIAFYVKQRGVITLEEVAHEIMQSIDFWRWCYVEDEEYKAIKEAIKVYQGFLDGGGEIDFTKG